MTAPIPTPADVAEAARLYHPYAHAERAAYLAGLIAERERGAAVRAEVLAILEQCGDLNVWWADDAERLAIRLRAIAAPSRPAPPAPDDGLFFFGEVALPMNSPAPTASDSATPSAAEAEAGRRYPNVLADYMDSDHELREIAKLQAASRDADKSMENLRAALAAAPPSPDLRHLTSEEQKIMHRARKAGAVLSEDAPVAGEKEDLSELIDLEQALRRAAEKDTSR